jgi:hypothetical protein
LSPVVILREQVRYLILLISTIEALFPAAMLMVDAFTKKVEYDQDSGRDCNLIPMANKAVEITEYF